MTQNNEEPKQPDMRKKFLVIFFMALGAMILFGWGIVEAILVRANSIFSYIALPLIIISFCIVIYVLVTQILALIVAFLNQFISREEIQITYGETPDGHSTLILKDGIHTTPYHLPENPIKIIIERAVDGIANISVKEEDDLV